MARANARDSKDAPSPRKGEGPRAEDRAPGRRRRSLRNAWRSTATSHSRMGERLIAGVPARIMRPRLVFICCLVAILGFGLLMVYSASSVEALKEQGSSTYYLERHAIWLALSTVFFLGLALRFFLPWRAFRSNGVKYLMLGIIGLLLVVLVIGAGGEEWGASRWISLPGGFNLQPSELAKPLIVLVAAEALAAYFNERSIDSLMLVILLAVGAVLPLVLIAIQPDLGTTLIIAATVLGMAFLAGAPTKIVVGVVAVVGALALGYAMSADYRLARITTSLDPWSDPYGDGYQATLAIMSFASGGLLGRGIGNSTMKYSYLPEAHNDYILAIIGEELGFVGTVLFIAVFLTMIAAAFRIAKQAPDAFGRLVASGSALALLAQFFVNVLGILSVLPMTGKPLPFVSYGGSALLTSMLLAALILRVSLESNVRSAADERRADFAVMSEGDDLSSHMGRSTAGEARRRSARAGGDGAAFASGDRPSRRTGFSVYEGGAAQTRPRPREDRDRPRGGYERINLNGDGTDRLRQRDGRARPDRRERPGSASAGRWGGERASVRRDPSGRRDRYDR